MLPISYTFPAILSYEGTEIGIIFPDLPGCTSHAFANEDPLKPAREALGGHLAVSEDFGDVIPTPSMLLDIETKSNERVVLVDVYMPPFRDNDDTKAVSRTVTIPTWMDRLAAERGIKISGVLQSALREQLLTPQNSNYNHTEL